MAFMNSFETKKNQVTDIYQEYMARHQPPNAEENKNNAEQKAAQQELLEGEKIEFPIKTMEQLNSELPTNFISEINKSEDLKFYQQATAVYDIPQVNIIDCVVQNNNPSIFACIAKVPNNWKDIDLRELMTFDDYSRLSKLRARNYVSILKMFYRVFKGHPKEKEFFVIFKKKLFQIQPLLKYHGIYGQYKGTFDRIRENKELYEDKNASASVNQSETQASPNLNFEDPDEADNVEQHDSDQEYEDFYSSSNINNGSWTWAPYELSREEIRWEKRAAWLEQMLSELYQNPLTVKWVPWFQAKMDSLVDLDVNINTYTQKSSPKVFYLAEFLDQYKKDFNPATEYEQEEKIYIEQNNFYPKVNIPLQNQQTDIQNLKSNRCSYREKLCLKVKQMEADTDYFLTVYKKKEFGNEKIYEKRINIRHYTFGSQQCEFSPCGKYLSVSFNLNYQNFTLIFSLNAKYKDPLLIKPNSKKIGFLKNKFYCYESRTRTIKTTEIVTIKEEIKEELKEEKKDEKKESKKEEKKAEKQTEKIVEKQIEKIVEKQVEKYYLYEYDLENFKNIKKEELPYQISQNENMKITENGLIYWGREVLNQNSEDTTKKPQEQYNIWIKNQCLILPDTEHLLPNSSESKLYTNNEGNRFLLIYIKDTSYVFQTYSLELLSQNQQKDQTTKLENHLYIKKDDLIKPYFKEFDDDKTKLLNVKIASISQYFLLMLKIGTKTYLCQEDELLTVFESNDSANIQFEEDDQGELEFIFFKNNFEYGKNNISFNICKKLENPTDKRLEWRWEYFNYPILNTQYYTCFPYFYYIYNHDQVIVKNLSKPKNQGFYYMNHFLGIDSTMRPLTVFAMVTNEKMRMMVATIQSNYTSKNFVIRMHSLRTLYWMTHKLQFEGYMRQRHYACNQEVLQTLKMWLSMFQKDSLHNDIRITNRYNSIAIERWENQKCKGTIMMSYYSMPITSDRNVTKEDTQLHYRNQAQWLFIYQDNNIVYAYTKEQRYSFGFYSIRELEPIWTYTADEQAGEIYDVIVDNLNEKQVDIYLLFSNATMKRFTGEFSRNKPIEAFVEDPYLYSIENGFKQSASVANSASGGSASQDGMSKGSAGAATTGASVKKIDLFESQADIYIANRILYSKDYMIDLSIIRQNEKQQTGHKLIPFFQRTQEIQKLTFSVSEAKLVGVFKDGNNQFKLVVSPLLNVRQLPLFQQNQFTHPVVPLVNKEKGYTQLFTLDIGHKYHYYQNMTHERYRKKHYDFSKMSKPGLVVKYFNGIEESYPLIEYGEELETIFRFKQSLNGSYFVIAGSRVHQKLPQFENQKPELEEVTKKLRSHPQYSYLNSVTQYKDQAFERELHHGLFLYKLDFGCLQRIKSFLYSYIDPVKIDSNVKEAFGFDPRKIYEYVEPEIIAYQKEEYRYNYTEGWYGFHQDLYNYTETINLRNYDEEVFKQEKEKEFNEQEEKKKKELKEQQKNSPNKNAEKVPEVVKTFQDVLKEDQEYIDFVRIPQQIDFFPGFDFPMMEHKPRVDLERNERNDRLIREYDNEKQLIDQNLLNEQEREKRQELYNKLEGNYLYVYTDSQRSRIEMMHTNYHLQISDDGDMFLIERLHNKLYYFYQNQQDQKYKLLTQKFEKDFQITAADSSKDFIVVTSNNRCQVIKIQRNLQQNGVMTLQDYVRSNYSGKLQNFNFVIYDSKQKQEEKKDEEKKDANSGEEKKKIVQESNYAYKSMSCSIKGEYLIMRIVDVNDTEYIRLYNIEKQINGAYIEGQNIVISGDKQYLWMQDSQSVFDILNGLSTYFLWPTNQIVCSCFDSYDLFNVNPDRTIMSTLGFLYLTFDYISFQVDEGLSNKFSIKDSSDILYDTKYFRYLYYKIGDYRSILEKIFKEEKDKEKSQPVNAQQNNAEESKTEEQKKEELTKIQSNECKMLTTLLNFLTENYNPEFNDSNLITNFFFSYYKISKNDETKQIEYQNIFEKLFKDQTPRLDLIDDILHYVVSSNVPTLQYVVNTCFYEFLETAPTSQAFQTYLNEILQQTAQMKEIEKFNVNSNDQGFYVNSHNSPIMDNEFQKNFRDTTKPKKDVSIYYINLGQILAEDGEKMMELLCDDKYLFLMNIPFIQYLVMYQWENVRSKIQKRLLIPFFLLLGFYFVYATFQIDWYKDYEADRISTMADIVASTLNDPNSTPEEIAAANEIESNLQAMMKGTSNFTFLWLINVIGLLVILFYMYFMEAKQVYKSGWSYFTQFWNIADIFNYTLCFSVIIMDIWNFPITQVRPTASVCVIILWIKLFYFLRVFETTSQLVRMIIEIVNDMKNFLIVLGIGVLGFANGLYILAQNQKDGIPPFVGDNFLQALIYTYRLALGDFQADEFYNLYPIDVIIVWAIFIIASLFVVIVLLNLLIAIMGDTFSRVLENITNLTIREKVLLVSENESLFNRANTFKNSQYLVVIKEKSLESLQAENWDGQINALKRQMMDRLSNMQMSLDQKIVDVQNEVKKRFTDFDEKSKKKAEFLEQKIQGVSHQEMELLFGKMQQMLGGMFGEVVSNISAVREELNGKIEINQENVGYLIHSMDNVKVKLQIDEGDDLHEQEQAAA